VSGSDPQIEASEGADRTRAPAGTPLGPRTPAPLQSLSYGLDPYGYFARSQSRYGDGFLARPFGQRWVVLSDPAAIRELFACGPDDLDSGAANADLRPILGLRNVLMLDGTEHLRRRRIVLPPLHGGPLRAYEPLIEAAIDRQIERWAREPRARILPMMQSLTLEVALGAIYGVEDVDGVRRLGGALRRLLSWTTDVRRMLIYGFLGPDRLTNLRGFRRQLAAVDDLVHAEISARREDPGLDQRIDVLSVLLRARDENGARLSDRDIRDELAVLMIAGHETTAAMLSWGLREIAAHPDVQDQLAAGRPGFAEAVVRETLRLHPPVPLGALRISRKPLRIGGRDYPAETTFAPCALLLHRRPDLYPEPLHFRPERFVDRKPGSGEWIPFGGGVRRCLGAALAEMEGRMVFTRATEMLEMSGPRLPSNRIARRGLILVPPPGLRRPRARSRRTVSA
jgi:cytochrome P450